jgi:hypothetical protein
MVTKLEASCCGDNGGVVLLALALALVSGNNETATMAEPALTAPICTRDVETFSAVAMLVANRLRKAGIDAADTSTINRICTCKPPVSTREPGGGIVVGGTPAVDSSIEHVAPENPG